MRHSIISVILTGILVGALFFFMPKLVLGIFIFFIIIRLLHIGFMGHRWYGHGYYGHGYGGRCDCGCGYGYGDDCNCEKDYEHHHHHNHHHGYKHGNNFQWADKIRSMSEEDYAAFKSKMEKGFGYGYHGRYSDHYEKCNCGEKSASECDCETSEKKEETTK